jgi:hypothetical protein
MQSNRASVIAAMAAMRNRRVEAPPRSTVLLRRSSRLSHEEFMALGGTPIYLAMLRNRIVVRMEEDETWHGSKDKKEEMVEWATENASGLWVLIESDETDDHEVWAFSFENEADLVHLTIRFSGAA